MKLCLHIAAFLISIVSLCAQRNELPNPDSYPADTILVMLREDTMANEFKAWVINRTDSIVIVNITSSVIYDWLEVKDNEENWRAYKTYPRRMLSCGYGLEYKLPLKENEFVNASTPVSPGEFQTSARARFTLDSVAYYSSEIAVSIDTAEFLHPYLRDIASGLRRRFEDDDKFQSRMKYFQGFFLVKKKQYDEASKMYAEALSLDSTNYKVLIAQGDLKIRLAGLDKLDDKQISEVLEAVFESYKTIPIKEVKIHESIESRRKAYAKWLPD